MKRFPAYLAAGLMSAACVASSKPSPPPANPQPPAPRARPAPAPPPPVTKRPPAADPPAVRPIAPPRWCDRSAPLVYTEHVRSRNPRIEKLQLELRQRGTWTYRRGGKVIGGGCLEPKQYRQILRALRAADFKQPPQPRIRCAAVPGTFHRYTDVRGKRTARSSSPCGTRANKDVYALSKLVHRFVGPQPPLHRPPPPPQPHPPAPKPLAPNQRCLRMHTLGRVLYREQTWPARRRMPASKRILISGLTVYSGGAYIKRGRGFVKRGCLSAATIERVRVLLRAARFRKDPRVRVVCKAMPRYTTLLSSPARGRSFSYRHPCGVPPDPTLNRLRNFVRRHAR